MAGRKKQTDVSLPAKKPRRRGVTKDELKAELARFATREEIDAKLATKDELKAELARFATREEIDAKLATKDELGAVKDELKAEIAKCATKNELAAVKDELKAEIAAVNARFDQYATRAEMEEMFARHIGAAMEEVRTWFRALDDKYRDLPTRVAALEARAEK